MSKKNSGEWLLSQNRFATHGVQELYPRRRQGQAITVSITSGKGGVGKTSVSVKMARELSDNGYKVLLIDCDYNLSNTAVKLGLPLSEAFLDFKNERSSFDECLYKDGLFHLFSACNGNLDLFEESFRIDQFIVQVLSRQEKNYDYILLDCPAGLSKDTLALNAYSDYRCFVVTPDRSSITDSYSLIKILNKKFGVKTNHLVVNKLSNKFQYNRIVKTLSEISENFLGARLSVLGGLPKDDQDVDHFDQFLLKNADTKFHRSFLKMLNRFTEESDGVTLHPHGHEDWGLSVRPTETVIHSTVS
jgi:flagellar biosynthesis protein FlhG